MSTITENLNGVKEKMDTNITNSNSNDKETHDTNGTVTAPSWLDKEFMETVLRRDADNDELSVVDIDVKNAVPKGDNYASLLFRVGVNYRNQCSDKEVHNRSLIVKSVPDGEIMRKWIDEMQLFAHEERIYNVTLQQIYKLLKERTGVKHDDLATRIYANDRPDTIILEDLKPLGYKMANRRQGLDLKHSTMALRTLAKLHGFSIALYAEDPSSMDEYEEKMYTEESRKMQTDMMTTIFKKLGEEVRTWPGSERFEEKLLNMNSVCVDKMIELVKSKPGSIRVLCHGDFWTNNMLFRYDEEENVEDVKMLDFQMVRFASPALDLIYFLHTSPKQQVLEDHRDELLREYHAALCDAMRLVDCDPQLFITKEQLNQEMEDKAFFAVVISCMFCIMVAEPEDAPDFSTITEEDMEKGDVNTMNKAFAGKRFRQAFERRLPKFEAQGLI